MCIRERVCERVYVCLRVCVFSLVLNVCLCIVHPSVIWSLLLLSVIHGAVRANPDTV